MVCLRFPFFRPLHLKEKALRRIWTCSRSSTSRATRAPSPFIPVMWVETITVTINLHLTIFLIVAILLLIVAFLLYQGFLSESPELPVALMKLPTPIPTTEPHKGVAFIGPPASCLQLFGDKQAAKNLAVKCGVNVVPGTDGAIKNADEAVRFMKSLTSGDKVYEGVMVKVGWTRFAGLYSRLVASCELTFSIPITIQAVYGGGGRGMRAVTNIDALPEAVARCQSEAKASFGRDEV